MKFWCATSWKVKGVIRYAADQKVPTIPSPIFSSPVKLEHIYFCSGMNKTKRFIFLPRKTQKTRNLLFFVLFAPFVEENYSRLIWKML